MSDIRVSAGINIEKTTSSVYNNNMVEVCGYVETAPVVHHRTHEENIYSFTLRVPRLNPETSDYLPIKLSERAANISSIKVGDIVRLEGQFRSFNKVNRETNKTSLELSIFVRNLTKVDKIEALNTIHLVGHLCKEPTYRTTPSGREISDVILAVNRVYGRSDYIPCIAWSRNARFVSGLMVGDAVIIEGRVQSRKYYKRVEGQESLEEHIVYEVSIFKIVKNAAETEGVVVEVEEIEEAE